MRILLTRPRADSEAMVAPLRARGDVVLIEPLIDIVPTGEAISLDGVQAIIATSTNGIRALAGATDERTLPVFTVGDATARAARAVGFTAVESAAGDSTSLARLILSRAAPSAGVLLHVRGRDIAGHLVDVLAEAGYTVRPAVLYAAEAAAALSPAVRARIAAGEIDAVLFFSPRTARTFVNLARDASIGDACAGITALCLSPAVADAASPLPWREIRVAAAPNQAALMKELDRVAGNPGPHPPVTDSNDRKTSPSTLEKAVARDAEERKPDAANGGDDKPAAETEGATEPPARGRLSLRVAVVLAVLLVLAGSYIAWPLWGPVLPGWLRTNLAPVMEAGRSTGLGDRVALESGRIDALERTVSGLAAKLDARPRIDPAWLAAIQETARNSADQTRALATQVDALRQKLAEAGRTGGNAALDKRLADLEARIAALSAKPGSEEAAKALESLRTQSAARMTRLEQDNLALRQTVAALDRRLSALENRPPAPAGATRANALVLAVGQLREAARGTGPFTDALGAVEALAGDDAALQTPIKALKPHAADGAPDLTALRVDFDRIAGKVAHEAFVPKGTGWIDRTLQHLARIVTFRRTDRDAATRDDENGRVARAELHLAAGDLAGAVHALDGLTGRAAEIAAPWLKAARARLAVDRSIEALYAEALRRTGASTGAPRG